MRPVFYGCFGAEAVKGGLSVIQVQRFDYDNSLKAILLMFREDPETFASLEVLLDKGPDEIDEYLEAMR